MEQKSTLRQCVIPLHKPSNRELAFFFISGMAISFPFALFFEGFSVTISLIGSVVVLGPLIEELAKVFPLFYRHGETERSIANLGLMLGLGFGITEFLEYTIFFGSPVLVRIPGIIFHASSATITSYGIAKKNPLPYYLIAASLHIANNFFAVDQSLGFGIVINLIVLLTTYYLAWYFYHKTSTEKMVV